MKLGERRSGVLLLVGALVLGGAGCGGGSKASNTLEQDDAAAGTTTTTAASTGTTAKPASGKKASGGGATPTTTAGATPTTAGSTSPTSAPQAEPLTKPGPEGQLELEATLAKTCVKPGGSQSITIKTRPGSAVGYDAVYSDGSAGMNPPHHGGNSGGEVDEQGTWQDTWVVAPTAPAGKVHVNVLGSHVDYGFVQKTLVFTVAGATGSC